jgi:hypothetical protein
MAWILAKKSRWFFGKSPRGGEAREVLDYRLGVLRAGPADGSDNLQLYLLTRLGFELVND